MKCITKILLTTTFLISLVSCNKKYDCTCDVIETKIKVSNLGVEESRNKAITYTRNLSISSKNKDAAGQLCTTKFDKSDHSISYSRDTTFNLNGSKSVIETYRKCEIK